MSNATEVPLPIEGPSGRDRFLRACLAEYLKFGWYLTVAVAFLVAVGPVLPTASVGVGAFLSPPALLSTLAVAVALVLKPLAFDDRLHEHLSVPWLLRTGTLLACLLAFGTFGARLFAGDPSDVPAALGAILGTVVPSDANPVGVVAYALVWGAVVLSAVVASSAFLGAVVGAVLGFVLGNSAVVAGATIGAGLGALLFSTVLFLDVRQVDRGAVGGAASALVCLLIFAPDPASVAVAVALAAALFSGVVTPGPDVHERATNGLLALRDPDGPERIPGYGGQRPGRLTDEEPSVTGLVRFAYGYVVLDRAGNGTANSAMAATIVALVSPAFLFVPLLWVAGYVFRCCGAAAHGHDDVPAFTYTGRHALFKEGALGVVGLLPYALVAGAFLPSVLRAAGGYGTEAAAVVAAAYGAVGLPVVAAGGTPLGVLALALFLALAPAVLLGYAVEGRLRGAFGFRRIAGIVATTRYAKYLLVQGLVLAVPVAVGTTPLAVALALDTIRLPGVVVIFALVMVTVAVAAFVPFASAALWGGYWHWEAFERSSADANAVPGLPELLEQVVGAARSTVGGGRMGTTDADRHPGAGRGSGEGNRAGGGSGSPAGADSAPPDARDGPDATDGPDAGDVFERYPDKWRESGGRFEYGVKRPSGSYRYFDDREDAAAALRDWYDEE